MYAIYFKGLEERHQRENSNGYPGRGGGYPGGGGPYPGGSPYPGGGGPYPGGGRRGGGDRRPEEPKVDGKKIMQRITKETGGRFFEVAKKQLVGDVYASISEELRCSTAWDSRPTKTPPARDIITWFCR